MKILVDADACPVVRIVEQVAKEFQIPVVLLCDTHHILKSDYSEIVIVGAGPDAVDLNWSVSAEKVIWLSLKIMA